MTCEICINRKRARELLYRSEGRCSCGRARKPDRLQCALCLAAHNRISASTRSVALRAKVCTRCLSRSAARLRTMCNPCLDQLADRARARRVAQGRAVGSKHCGLCGEPGHSRERHARDVEFR